MFRQLVKLHLGQIVFHISGLSSSYVLLVAEYNYSIIIKLTDTIQCTILQQSNSVSTKGFLWWLKYNLGSQSSGGSKFDKFQTVSSFVCSTKSFWWFLFVSFVKYCFKNFFFVNIIHNHILFKFSYLNNLCHSFGKKK